MSGLIPTGALAFSFIYCGIIQKSNLALFSLRNMFGGNIVCSAALSNMFSCNIFTYDLHIFNLVAIDHIQHQYFPD